MPRISSGQDLLGISGGICPQEEGKAELFPVNSRAVLSRACHFGAPSIPREVVGFANSPFPRVVKFANRILAKRHKGCPDLARQRAARPGSRIRCGPLERGASDLRTNLEAVLARCGSHRLRDFSFVGLYAQRIVFDRVNCFLQAAGELAHQFLAFAGHSQGH